MKPVDNLSIYTAYSISYLPASGDQFSTLNNGIFFTFWIVLLSRVPSIRGYELGDVAVLYGIVAVGHGLAVFFAGGLEQLARAIDDGELDSLLAQPKPTLL